RRVRVPQESSPHLPPGDVRRPPGGRPAEGVGLTRPVPPVHIDAPVRPEPQPCGQHNGYGDPGTAALGPQIPGLPPAGLIARLQGRTGPHALQGKVRSQPAGEGRPALPHFWEVFSMAFYIADVLDRGEAVKADPAEEAARAVALGLQGCASW